jgi:hypothetical protein
MKKKYKISIAVLCFFLAVSIPIIGYAAWLGNRSGNGGLITGDLYIYDIDADVQLTGGTNKGLIPFDQPEDTYDPNYFTKYYQYSVVVNEAETNYDLSISVHGGQLAPNSELRVSAVYPTAINAGQTLLEGATAQNRVIYGNQSIVTDSPVVHTFYIFLRSSNLADRNQPIDFVVTISPTQ